MKRPDRLTSVCVLAMAGAIFTATAFAQEDRYFDSAGIRIHYVEQGSGVPIVLLHGAGGSTRSWRNWEVFESLARDHRVIAVDARGHGLSDKPHDPKQYGREMGFDVVRLLDHLGIARAHIVGVSLGAQTLAQLLTLRPERFITATLASGAGRFHWTDEDRRIVEQEAIEVERDGMSRTQLRRLAAPGTPEISDDDFAKIVAGNRANPNFDALAVAAMFRGSSDQAITEGQVAKVTVPTLGIVGSADPYLSDLQRLKQLRPDITVVIVADATHGDQTATPARPEFLAAITNFIASHPGRP